MKEYQSHKVVEAAKITDATNNHLTGGAMLHLEGAPGETVDHAWLRKHGECQELIGGYLVRYPGDGYLSWSPAEAFEKGYTEVDEGGGFKAPPVAGYNDQPGSNLTIVNSFKEAEERVLRRLDEVAANASPGAVDQRWYAIGRTHIEQGFMAVNRAIFQPGRVKLPEDAAAASGEAPTVSGSIA